MRVQLKKAQRREAYEQIAPIARKILEFAPQDNKVWAALAQAQLETGDMEGIRKTLEEWRRRVERPSPKLDEYDGNVAHHEKDFSRALHLWQRSLSAKPKNVRVLQKIAQLQHAQKHWPEENNALSAIIAIRDNAAVRAARALCRRHLHDWDGAVKDFQRARELAPDDPDVQRCVKIFDRLTKFIDPDKRVRRAMRRSAERWKPSRRSRAPLSSKRGCGAGTGRCGGRRETCSWAVRPRLFRALALIALNRIEECEKLFVRKTFATRRANARISETISRLDSAISVERQNADLYASRAWQLNEIGQPALALQDGETGLRFDIKAASACAEAGYALMKMDRPHEAFEKAKRATELDPNFAAAWQYRGELEMVRGDHVSAVESLTRALAINQTPIALQKREECYRRLGLTAKADQDRKTLETMRIDR